MADRHPVRAAGRAGTTRRSSPCPARRRTPTARYSPADIDLALSDTSNLSDAAKVKAEYWADGPKSEFPPGHMAVFAQALSRMRGDTLDQDAKLFFALGNALLDASISSWAAKYEYDFARPATGDPGALPRTS